MAVERKTEEAELLKRLEELKSSLSGNEDAEELLEMVMDIIYDYDLAVKENKHLRRKYETPAKPIKGESGFFICPVCHRKLYVSNNHCGRCGKMIDWLT